MVAGSWQTAGESGCGGNDGFVVLFDGVPVPTETVHPGLLKCHAPGESNLLTINSNSRKWKNTVGFANCFLRLPPVYQPCYLVPCYQGKSREI